MGMQLCSHGGHQAWMDTEPGRPQGPLNPWSLTGNTRMAPADLKGECAGSVWPTVKTQGGRLYIKRLYKGPCDSFPV